MELIFQWRNKQTSNHIKQGDLVCIQLCSTLCDPMDNSLPVSSVHENFQERILKWIAISYFMVPLPSHISRLQHSTPACLLVLSVFQGLALPLSLNFPSFATFLSFLFFISFSYSQCLFFLFSSLSPCFCLFLSFHFPPFFVSPSLPLSIPVFLFW